MIPDRRTSYLPAPCNRSPVEEAAIGALFGYLNSVWWILAEAAPYVLFGFLAAGLLRGLLPPDLVSRHLGGQSVGSVLKASLLGIPLPLCSCGVIPAAVDLRRQGAGRGASAAFMVSTPESGLDSIAITWALLDPVMTVVRPLAAFLTATVTGLAVNLLPEHVAAPVATAQPAESVPHDCGCADACPAGSAAAEPPSRSSRIAAGIAYAFGDLLGDIGGWLLLGIVLAGLIGHLMPVDFFERYLGGEFPTLLLMLLMGVPLYICATASTPVAAAMVAKGLSPGAALVFLLAGPATNAATIAVVARHWGRREAVVYVASIAACSLALGLLVDRLYVVAGLDIGRWVSSGTEPAPGLFSSCAALLLLALIARNLHRGARFLPLPSSD